MKLSDADLLIELKKLVTQERELLTKLLRYLREAENRKLYLARGYSSMFAFVTNYLSYSETEAYARIQAMRLIQKMPEVEQHIESGRITLTVAAQAESHFRRVKAGTEKKVEVVAELLDASKREAERKLAEHFPEEAPREKTQSLPNNLTRIAFNANDSLYAKLEKLKALLAHKNFQSRYDLLFEALADIALKKLEKPNDQAQLVPAQVKTTGYIPERIRYTVRHRDQGECQYTDPETGHKCKTRHGLQFDHIQPYASGGRNTVENLRLLCGAHNRWRNHPASG